MRTFKIRVAEDTIIPIRANSVEEARKIARAQIYTKAASPLYDTLFFDYETGVNIKQGLGKDLRQKLGRAETETEQNDVLRKSVNQNRPNLFANQFLNLANAYNGFYRDCKVINNGVVNQLYFAISEIVSQLLKSGMEALGIKPLEKM